MFPSDQDEELVLRYRVIRSARENDMSGSSIWALSTGSTSVMRRLSFSGRSCSARLQKFCPSDLATPPIWRRRRRELCRPFPSVVFRALAKFEFF